MENVSDTQPITVVEAFVRHGAGPDTSWGLFSGDQDLIRKYVALAVSCGEDGVRTVTRPVKEVGTTFFEEFKQACEASRHAQERVRELQKP
jgi:hypothetical protein